MISENNNVTPVHETMHMAFIGTNQYQDLIDKYQIANKFMQVNFVLKTHDGSIVGYVEEQHLAYYIAALAKLQDKFYLDIVYSNQLQ